jgi:6-phosphogluconolactonase (cycloisomerase 2 family)
LLFREIPDTQMKVIKPSKLDCSRPERGCAIHKKSTGELPLMRSGWLRCVLVACWLVNLVNCGSSGKSGFVYLASQGSDPGTITAYSLSLSKGTLSSSNGALTQAGKSAATGTQPGPLIFDPTNSFAFVADFGNPLASGNDNSKKSGDVAAFSVNKDGSLTSVGPTLPPAIACETLSPVALAMDPGGKFLFVASQGFSNVAANEICPFPPPNGTPASGVVSVFGVSSGKLTALANTAIPVPPGASGTNTPTPTAVAVSNQGSFVYVTDSVNATVVGFAFDSTGALSSVPGQFFTVGNTPRAVLSPPAGNFLYVANSGTDNIFEFVINTDGSLVPISATPPTIGTGIGPIALLTDPGAKYLYALANGGSQITGYTINHVTGALTAVGASGGTVSTGGNPVAFAIRSDGSTSGDFWVFTSNFGANTVSTFALNGATGALSPLPQLTGPVAPYGISAR